MDFVNKVKNSLSGHPAAFNKAQDVYISGLKVKYGVISAQKTINNKMVLFISFMGKQYSDSPRMLYEEMLKNPRYKDFHFVWVFSDNRIPENFIPDKRTKVVRYRSKAYYKACAISKYWISNVRMRSELIKKENQVYVQTWHGTPFKKLGFDISVDNFQDIGGNQERLEKNYLKDAKRYDYLISPSPFYSEKISSAFGLDQLDKMDIILEYGYPRNDILYTYTLDYVNRIKSDLKLDPDKKVILYAPTFREKEIEDGSYTFKLALDLEMMKKELGDEYTLLLRLHYYVASRLDISGMEDFVMDVSDYPDISELYLISDLLVTDYSSVFFDYAILNRPIFFFMYDFNEYKNTMHDFYLETCELPGKISTATVELIDHIKNADYESNDLNEEFNERFNPHKGPCSDKILKMIIQV